MLLWGVERELSAPCVGVGPVLNVCKDVSGGTFCRNGSGLTEASLGRTMSSEDRTCIISPAVKRAWGCRVGEWSDEPRRRLGDGANKNERKKKLVFEPRPSGVADDIMGVDHGRQEIEAV